MSAIRQQARAAVGALYAGDEGRAAELLAGIVAGPEIDVRSVVDATMGELMLAEVMERLQREFPSAFDDHDVALIADRRFRSHLANGRTKAEAARLAAREATEKLRVGRSHGAGEDENTNPSATIREMRKARGQAV